MTRKRFLACAAMVAGLTGLTTSASAAELSVSVPGGGPLIHGLDLVPGSGGSGAMVVTNGHSTAGLLHVRAVDVVEDDNACATPETDAGDTSCGTTGGELGDDLEFTVWVERGEGEERDEVFSGSIADLAEGVWLTEPLRSGASRGTSPSPPPGALPAGETWTVGVDYELPSTSGNETQTDRLGFDLEVTLTDAVSEEPAPGDLVTVPGGSVGSPGDTPADDDNVGSEVAGVGVGVGVGVGEQPATPAPLTGSGPGSDALGLLLARTGGPVGLLVSVGGLLVGIGIIARRAGRRPTA